MQTNTKQTAIEVLEVRGVANAGSLQALVRLRLGSVVIHGVRIIQQPEQRAWVAMPQVALRDKPEAKARGWVPVVEIISPALKERISEAVLQAWEGGKHG